MTTEYDGVRPRHAVCPACDYRFGGIPIQQGSLTCPECGASFSFVLPSHARPANSWSRGLIIPFITLLMVAASMSFLAESILAGLIVMIIGVGFLVVLARFRRSILG